jgi:hypothetical protein
MTMPESTENEEDDLHSLETHGSQSDDYTVCGSALDVCEVQTVGQARTTWGIREGSHR